MELTGKCKEEFEKWFEPPLKDELDPWEIALHGTMVAGFYTHRTSMQWGVLVDYFDSVGIIIEAYKYSLNLGYGCMINNNSPKKGFTTMDESRIAAIEKAGELRNEVLKVR